MYKFGSFVVVLSTYLFVTLATSSSRSGLMKETKILCETMEPNAFTFKECLLERNKENLLSLNIHLSLSKSATNILLNGRILRKVNSKYVLFFYDDTVNFCDFVGNSKKHIFWSVAYKTLAKYSNLNHTCPYNHDLIVNGYVIRAKDFDLLPLPRGDYMVQVQLGYDNAFKAKLQLFFSRL